MDRFFAEHRNSPCSTRFTNQVQHVLVICADIISSIRLADGPASRCTSIITDLYSDIPHDATAHAREIKNATGNGTDMADSTSHSIKVFISYAHKDEVLWKELDAHLGALKYENIIKLWWDGQIKPGTDWNEEIAWKLEEADLILLLISADFLNSAFCYNKEMRRAVDRHKAGRAHVVPIILRSCYWNPAPFAKLQGLPKDMKPVADVPKHKRDTVWAQVTKGIHQAAKECATGQTIICSKQEVKIEKPIIAKAIEETFFHIPSVRNLFFIGREDTLEALQGALTSQERVMVITGVGGIGKTQTALEYAYRHREDYRVVWWMEAESAGSLDRGVAELAAALQLPDADPTDPVRTRAALCRWMKSETGWLLILDDADEPKMVQPYLPVAPAGHVLITSRNPHWRSMGQTVPLGPWPREHAMEFLIRRTDRATTAGAATLAAELGDLPLALAIAASYIKTAGLSFEEYSEKLKKQPERAYETISIDETLGKALDKVMQESPMALDLLRLFAFLAPKDISRDLVTAHAMVLPHGLAEAITDEVAFDRAIAVLGRSAMIEVTPDSFAVHPLVQAITRARLSDPLPWADAAIALINAAFPEDSDDVHFWPICARLRFHAEVALTAAQDFSTDATRTSRLLDRLATYLQSQGFYLAAQPLFKRALAIREKAFGLEHLDVAASLTNLAWLYITQGFYDEAELLHQRALAIREKVFGPEHPKEAIEIRSTLSTTHPQDGGP